MPPIDLAVLTRSPEPLVTRFAPSPTGLLHLGHVVNAIYVWGIARRVGASVLLRIEDHDRIRCRPEYERQLLEDLDWLGFIPDSGRNPVRRQSDTPTTYQDALTRLREAEKVYACDCSRREIRLREGSSAAERYSGHCRHRHLADAPGRGLRVRIEAGAEDWDDLRLGHLSQAPADQCGDLLVRDRDGHWTYQFAVTVDDARDGVNLVIRGEDLLDSTGRQLRLGRLLGRTSMPRFLHHPLLLKPSGEKLSKSSGDTGIANLRAAGVTAAEVIGRAAAAVGLTRAGTAIPAHEVASLFT
jgi:glutamyl-tRNA synthetase/glutamyl-Q tRNA(Asp) synthetase